MRPRIRAWMVLLVGAIAFVGGMFWLRAHPQKKLTPLEEAVEALWEPLGMRVEEAPGARGASGLAVKEIRPGSVAEQAGVQVGDRVVAVGDRSVWHAVQLQELISEAMRRQGGCMLMLSRERKSGSGSPVRAYRTVTLGYAAVAAPPPPEEEGHQD